MCDLLFGRALISHFCSMMNSELAVIKLDPISTVTSPMSEAAVIELLIAVSSIVVVSNGNRFTASESIESIGQLHAARVFAPSQAHIILFVQLRKLWGAISCVPHFTGSLT
ncbi:hypothetical protein OESDEN_07204 [Oesophagostomum dentatum]|uniref:Uncharacterized protein n=1 Tax=Oesophagostomum dentatum TaxID=61180 RepID=A0A0B1T6M1_OESDE|nr:hypothetical protein OESDEN_07204 [Oesophagostomum dentatum]